MLVSIYTDGAARGNPDGPGGYGTILEYVDSKGELHTKELSKGYEKTTNNRIAGVKTARTNTINVYDVMKYNTVIATKAAVKAIEEVYA